MDQYRNSWHISSWSNTINTTYTLPPQNNTFSSTVPFAINLLNDSSANGGIPLTTTNIVAGWYISKPSSKSLFDINLPLSGASHPLPACRIYSSQIVINPNKALTYVGKNRSEKNVYPSLIINNIIIFLLVVLLTKLQIPVL